VNESEFEQFMQEIDQTLRDRRMSVPARILGAVAESSKRLGTTLPLSHPGRELRKLPGVFIGESLSRHIQDWVIERYGKRLGIDADLGRVAVTINGDPWLMRVPMVIGRQFIHGWDRRLLPTTEQIQNIVVGGKLNVFDSIDGLTQTLARQISESDADRIVQVFGEAYVLFREFTFTYGNEGLARFASADLSRSATQALHMPTLAVSRWDSLQAAEKSLKLYIHRQGQRFAEIHNLSKLAVAAYSCGLPSIDPALLAAAQCSASVRYVLEQHTVEGTMAAHSAAIKIGYAVVKALMKGASSSP